MRDVRCHSRTTDDARLVAVCVVRASAGLEASKTKSRRVALTGPRRSMRDQKLSAFERRADARQTRSALLRLNLEERLDGRRAAVVLESILAVLSTTTKLALANLHGLLTG
jgi:hypothetical protein